MKKSEKLSILLRHPLKTINSGVMALREDLFAGKVRKEYSISQLPTIDLLDLFPEFTETLDYYSFLEGTSLVTDLMLLKSLAKRHKECSYLEIGTWRGESIANVSEVSAKCLSVTLPEEEMKLPEDKYALSGFFSQRMKNIETIKKNSRHLDFGTLGRKFDLIFIDGDHSYEGVLNDTVKTFNLRNDGQSVIVWHDYGFTTEKVRYSVLAAILEGIPGEYHRNLFHVSNTLCAVYMENNLAHPKQIDFPTFPDKNFRIRVTAERITPGSKE